jgi:hypothetical protein
MEIVRFAFYKANMECWTDFLVAGWTGLWNFGTPEYSHVEIGFFINDKWEYFSSASRNPGKPNGTRWITGDDLLKNRDRWDVYEADAIYPTIEMIEIANSMLGCRYDWWGIAGFATIFGLLNVKNKWYCSEACFRVFFKYWKKRISPRGLFSKIKTLAILIKT